MIVKDLKPGDSFKRKGQKKYRTVASITVIKNLGGRQPKEHIGSMLIVDTDCLQWILDPHTAIIAILCNSKN